MNPFLLMAWRNVWRNRRRSLLTILGLAFASVVLIFTMALQKGSYVDMVENTVKAQTGHLQVQREGYWPDQELEKKLVVPSDLAERIASLSHVKSCAPRIRAAALVSKDSRSFASLVTGIDPAREAAHSTLAATVRSGAYLEPDDEDGALIGELLARNLDAKVGDEIVFMGQGADGSIAAGRVIVRGIYKSGFAELDRASLVLHVRSAQEWFSMYGGISELAVLLDDDRYRDEVRAQIESLIRDVDRAVVLDWPELLPGVEDAIRMDWMGGLILYGLLVAVVGFGIANTFLMAYLERRFEFGTLLAIGMKPTRLARLVYLESVLLSISGIALGVLVATPLTLYFNWKGITFNISEEMLAQYGMDATINPVLLPSVYGWALGIIVFVAAVAALYPALKVQHLKAVEAMHGA